MTVVGVRKGLTLHRRQPLSSIVRGAHGSQDVAANERQAGGEDRGRSVGEGEGQHHITGYWKKGEDHLSILAESPRGNQRRRFRKKLERERG